MEGHFGNILYIKLQLCQFCRHCLTNDVAEQIGVVQHKRIDKPRFQSKNFTIIVKILIKKLADNRIHIRILHTDFKTDFTDFLMIFTTVLMRI